MKDTGVEILLEFVMAEYRKQNYGDTEDTINEETTETFSGRI